jgi:hypothetical protein
MYFKILYNLARSLRKLLAIKVKNDENSCEKGGMFYEIIRMCRRFV